VTDRLVELNQRIEELQHLEDPELEPEINRLEHEAVEVMQERFDATHKPIVLAHERAMAKARSLLYGEKSVRWLGVTTYFADEYPPSFGLYRWPFHVIAHVKAGEQPRAELEVFGETVYEAKGETVEDLAREIDRYVAETVTKLGDVRLRAFND